MRSQLWRQTALHFALVQVCYQPTLGTQGKVGMANLGCSVCPTLSVAGLVEGGLVGVSFAGSHLGFHLGWDIENLRSYSPSLKLLSRQR